ncbi:hypothetical protein [Methanobrevibacter sp.]
MFKFDFGKTVLDYMNLLAHELGLLHLSLNILGQNLRLAKITGGV